MSCQRKINRKVSRIRKKADYYLKYKKVEIILKEMDYILQDEKLSDEDVLERLKSIEKELKELK